MTTVLVVVAIAGCVAAIIFFACVAVSVEADPDYSEPGSCAITGRMCYRAAPCNGCSIWQEEQQAQENRERFKVIENGNQKSH